MMAQYKLIHKKGGYKAGEEIRLHKVTTAEKANKVLIYVLIILTINLIFG